jgi:hypothetical protein
VKKIRSIALRYGLSLIIFALLILSSYALQHYFSTRFKVLVVDDHADSREMLATVLELGGAQVKSCETAREAYEAVQQWKPDVLVSDIGMPGEDGLALITKIRNLPSESGGNLAAIALSGYVRDVEAQRALQAGYQMHVRKPVEPSDLTKRILELVGGSKHSK